MPQGAGAHLLERPSGKPESGFDGFGVYRRVVRPCFLRLQRFMTKPNSCYAYFAVHGADLDPAAISAELGVAATKAWRKGDLDPRRRERITGHWSLYSRLSENAALEEHLADVILQMEGNPAAFAAVAGRYGGRLQLVGNFHDIGVGLNLSRQIVVRLAFFGLELDLDSYYLYSDARECTG